MSSRLFLFLFLFPPFHLNIVFHLHHHHFIVTQTHIHTFANQPALSDIHPIFGIFQILSTAYSVSWITDIAKAGKNKKKEMEM
jgi:hypothetical protein